jgi:pimeloyl-ACP methyl ester carboxylesterase
MDRFVSKDGTSIASETSGWGPPVVLVHGTAADHTRWAPVVPALAQGCTVYAIDRRGRGQSGDAAAYALEREFEDVATVVETVGVPVDLVGHSFGALCALEAVRLAANVRRLVLYEPPLRLQAPLYPPGLIDRLQRLLDAGDREAVVLSFLREVVRVPDDQLAFLQTLPAWPARVAAAHTIIREMRAHESYAFQASRFREIRTPTLLLVGSDSPPVLRQATSAVHGTLASSRVRELAGQQHVAIDTATELFVGEVLGFLSARVVT